MPEYGKKFENEEPSADWRGMAKMFREMYVALVHEGFTEKQALELLSHTIGSSILANRKTEE